MKKEQMGPLQLLVFSFKAPNFEGKILDEVAKLNDSEVMRVIDSLAIHKDHSGNIKVLQTSQITADEATEYGAVIGGLIGLGSGDKKIAERTSREMAADFHARYEYGLDQEDIKEIANSIPEGSAALFALVEHLWAISLRDAVRGAGGMLVAQDFLSPEALMALGQDIHAGARA
jgi:uncharacterized membrane protein